MIERVYLPAISTSAWRAVNETISLLDTLAMVVCSPDDRAAIRDALAALRYLSTATHREVQLVARPPYTRAADDASPMSPPPGR